MKLIKINDRMIVRAAKDATKLGRLKKSYMDGDGNLIGMLGEEIFQQLYPSAIRSNTFDYDFILKNKYIDVKANIIGVEPRRHFDRVIEPLKAHKQNVDYFFFITIHSNLEDAWVIGYISKDKLLKAPHVESGSARPNGGVYRSSGYRVLFSELSNPNIL